MPKVKQSKLPNQNWLFSLIVKISTAFRKGVESTTKTQKSLKDSELSKPKSIKLKEKKQRNKK